MLGKASPPWIVVIAVIGTVCCARPGYAEVDLLFDPPSQTVTLDVDDIVEIDLVAHSSDGKPQPITIIDAILDWDPASLELLGVDDSNSGAGWFISGFLSDIDHINEGSTGPPDGVPYNDGDAIYTAWATPGCAGSQDCPAPGGSDLVVTTLRFRALRPTPATVVQFLPSLGDHGLTRVFGEGKQNYITGDISATATVVIVQSTCFADFDHDGQVGAFDLAVLLGAWGPCPDPCVPEEPSDTCPADLDQYCNVGPFDLALLLGAWGPCP